MSTPRKGRTLPRKSSSALRKPPKSHPVWRWLAMTMVAVACACATALGFRMLETRVAGPQAAPTPQSVRVNLTDVPYWMPEALAHEIARSLAPRDADFRDVNLTEKVYALAERNPWVRDVIRVSKHGTEDPLVGALEVTAEFRQPMAQVMLRDGRTPAFVDVEGVRLPDEPNHPQAPKWVVIAAGPGGAPVRTYYADRARFSPSANARKCHYICIEGVRSPSPPPGEVWQGADLADGLQLVRIILARKFALEIVSIDVSNHGGRIARDQPHIRLYAQAPDGKLTEIRFGRLPRLDGDYEVPTKDKLDHLEQYLAQYGSLAGHHRYIDLRFDRLHVSND